MVDTAGEIAKGLIPPRGGTSAQRFRYDLTVSCVLLGVTLMSGIHIAWACGYLSFIGLTGFANAADLKLSQQAIVSIQSSQLLRDIREDQTKLCQAEQARNGLALGSWQNLLAQAQDQYYRITGRTAPTMTCDELLIPPQ
jgi:hypothetical protein